MKSIACIIFCIILITACSSNSAIYSSSEPSDMEFATLYPSQNKAFAKLLNKYRSMGNLTQLQSDPERYSTHIISWQMEHGGFGLHEVEPYESIWDGQTSRSEWVSDGRELGNFDDDATVAEIRFLAYAYTDINDPVKKLSIKNSIERALQFILTAQYETGGWPQVYPKRKHTTYSNHVTLNDNAMIRTMVLLADIKANIAPFNSDIVSAATRKKIYNALENGIDYLLKAQIKSQGKLTIWAAQHHPFNYTPEPGRSYELVSKSGQESVAVLAFLMNWPVQSKDVTTAIDAALTWYQENKVDNMRFRKGEFIPEQGKDLWYRFYEIDRDIPFFSGRDGIKKYTLDEVSEERRTGYSWADSYASSLLKAIQKSTNTGK